MWVYFLVAVLVFAVIATVIGIVINLAVIMVKKINYDVDKKIENDKRDRKEREE